MDYFWWMDVLLRHKYGYKVIHTFINKMLSSKNILDDGTIVINLQILET